MAIKIAIANQKGGVGKTSTTISLGAALSKMGYRVLLIDSDAQGSMSISVGFAEPDSDEEYNLAVLYHLQSKGMYYEATDFIRHHDKEGYDYIVGNYLLADTDIALVNMMDREYILSDILKPLDALYDYIIIDCMPSLGFLTVNALTAADLVIIPTLAQQLAFKGMARMFRTIAQVQNRKNPNLKVGGVLVTMFTKQSKTENSFVELINAEYSEYRPFKTLIPRTVKMAESPIAGKSVLSYEKNSKVALAYEEFAKEVVERYGV